MNIKICGITSPEEALLAAELGVTHIGLNFYPASPRYLTIERARPIARALHELSERPLLVGVFVNENSDSIRYTLKTHRLDLAQLSGDEPKDMLQELGDCAYKAYRLGETTRNILDLTIGSGRIPAFLIDAHIPGQYGGTGQRCDWTAAASIARQHDVFLAGGLTPQNVAQAIRSVRPWGVDVASGVEGAAGIKDANKMRAFVTNALAAAERKSSEFRKPVLGRR